MLRAGGKTPGGSGASRMLRGMHVTYGKNFLGACRCMTVVLNKVTTKIRSPEN